MDRLIEAIIEKGYNPTVVGLDPQWNYIPDEIKKVHPLSKEDPISGACDAILDFNKRLISAVCHLVPAIKPNCAFYEKFGWKGMKVLSETISFAKENGLYVIADGKRNDIGNTFEAYAQAYLGKTTINEFEFRAFEADALTVNAYLGSDGIKPAIEMCYENDTDLFALLKTSNSSSGELQDLLIDGLKCTVYEHIGLLCASQDKTLGQYGYSHVGGVVGATFPKQLKVLRALLPNTLFLIPGYGAQGGTAKDIAAAFTNGLGAIVNSSRGIMCAWQKNPEMSYEKAWIREVILMRDDILSNI